MGRECAFEIWSCSPFCFKSTTTFWPYSTHIAVRIAALNRPLQDIGTVMSVQALDRDRLPGPPRTIPSPWLPSVVANTGTLFFFDARQDMSLSLFLLAVVGACCCAAVCLNRSWGSTTSQPVSPFRFHLLTAPPITRAPYSIGLLGVPEAVRAKPPKPNVTASEQRNTHIAQHKKESRVLSGRLHAFGISCIFSKAYSPDS